jgi:hypothetical protein
MSSWLQDRLNSLAGFTPSGQPILRLEFGSTVTWTPGTRDLKYLHRRDSIQRGWKIDVRDTLTGITLQTVKFPQHANLPDPGPVPGNPSQTYGLPYADIEHDIEIGVPRYYVSHFTAGSLIGEWDEARWRVWSKLGIGGATGLVTQSKVPGQKVHGDMGPRPDGMYYLGFHGIAEQVPHICCEAARQETKKAVWERGGDEINVPAPRKCFHLFRMPSEIDLLYIEMMWKLAKEELYQHEWTEYASEREILRTCRRMADHYAKQDKTFTDNMRLRIKDAMRTNRYRLTRGDIGKEASKYTYHFMSGPLTPRDNQTPRRESPNKIVITG